MKRFEETKHMKEFLANILHQTNEFCIIDTNYRFPEKNNLDEALNTYPERQILAIKKQEFIRENETGKYLIIADSALMKIKEIGAKLAAASVNDINTVHVLYKFLNSEGDFFRRTTRIDPTKDEASYRETFAYAKKSLKEIDHVKKNSILNLSMMERNILKTLTNNRVAYYQPNSARLDEKLLLIRYDQDVKADYSRSERKPSWAPSTTILKKYAYPIRIAEADLFTLLPLEQGAAERKINALDQLMKNKYSLRRVLIKKPLRIARALTLPNIECKTEDEIRLRYNLAILNEQMRINPRKQDLTYTARVQEQLETLDRFSEVYEALQEAYAQTPVEFVFDDTPAFDGAFPRTYTAKHKSKSQPEITHTTKVFMPSDHPDEWQYSCEPCKGWKYWKKCWHVNKLEETIKKLIKK